MHHLAPRGILMLGLAAASLGGLATPRAHGQTADFLVFSSGRSGQGDIYGFDLDSGELKLIVGSPAPEGGVRYDPFHDRLVHHRYSADAAMLVSGGRTLFVDPNGDVAPSWSSSGRIVYALEAEGGGDLFLADSLGESVERLTDDDAVERYPAWAPSGDVIVYAKRAEGGWDLYTLDVATKRESRLTYDSVYVGHPSWSPDGRRIAFDTLRDGQAEIAVLDLDDGHIELLTQRDGNDLIPSWAPDGKRVAFGAEAIDDNWDVWIVDVDTKELTRITTDPASDGGPVFVPASALDSLPRR
jgi:Tol biopolymer transport system component